MKNGILCLLCWCSLVVSAQKKTADIITRIDPPNWFAGMKDSSVQLMIYGKDICQWKVKSKSTVKIAQEFRAENPNYLFLTLGIPHSLLAQKIELEFSKGKEQFSKFYELKARRNPAKENAGVNASDFIYLLMPDRFSNGDSTNDVVKGMNETLLRRDSMFYRHGGDIQGIINHLDYLKDMGVTAIWSTPLLENNEYKTSYHGYAITDHYKIDPRFGSNSLYYEYVQVAHQKKLKVVMDMVYNHVGDQHWFIRDLPMNNWLNQWDTFTKTNYRAAALADPYASLFDKNKMRNGWFDVSMPDLNQQNTFVANYLIQNSIWWIETSGINGFRIDTYTYSDLEFMQHLAQRIRNEYPQFSMAAELWDHDVPLQAYFSESSNIIGARNSYMPGMIDFQIYHAMNEALTKPMDWTAGLSRVYYTLSQDFLYSNPQRNLLFLDNHDLSRFYSCVGEDLRKWKMGIGFLLTMRGIPSMYYGTEVLMKNFADPDGKVREDFKGGWKGDAENKFTVEGRTKEENEAFNFVKKLANYRKQSKALQTGKLMQFVPENDIYVYFRYEETKAIMVILRYSEKYSQLNLSRFSEQLEKFSKAKDIMTDEEFKLGASLQIEPYSVKVIELSN